MFLAMSTERNFIKNRRDSFLECQYVAYIQIIICHNSLGFALCYQQLCQSTDSTQADKICPKKKHLRLFLENVGGQVEAACGLAFGRSQTAAAVSSQAQRPAGSALRLSEWGPEPSTSSGTGEDPPDGSRSRPTSAPGQESARHTATVKGSRLAGSLSVLKAGEGNGGCPTQK